ncbi:MAG: histone deacetylase [Puniceicoccaceae bacterium]
MFPVGLIQDVRFLHHDTGPAHPENRGRLEHLRSFLANKSLSDSLLSLSCEAADPKVLSLVHDSAYIEYIQKTSASGPALLDDGDTRVSSASWEVALLAVGASIEAIKQVHSGRIQRAFVACRPPGHHAMRNHAMGFCLFNNIAIAARYAQQQLGYERIMILDWDVHHGNGTQDAFYRDPSVFFCSLHQYPFYPGTGSEREQGAGEGLHYTLNIPLPEGSDMRDYREAMKNQVFPAAEAFEPELLLISAGFDAHVMDPLGNMQLHDEDFRELTELSLTIANRHCGGKVISILEGGYHHDALARSVVQHLNALAQS